MGARKLNRRKLEHIGRSYIWYVVDLDYEGELRVVSGDKKLRITYELPQKVELSLMKISWEKKNGNKNVAKSIECISPIWFPDFTVTPKVVTQIIDWALNEIENNTKTTI